MRGKRKLHLIFLGLILLLASPLVLSSPVAAAPPSTEPTNSVTEQPTEEAQVIITGSFTISPNGASTTLMTENFGMTPNPTSNPGYLGAYYPSREYYAPVGAYAVPNTDYNREVYYEPRDYYSRLAYYGYPSYYDPRAYYGGYPSSGYGGYGYPSSGYGGYGYPSYYDPRAYYGGYPSSGYGGYGYPSSGYGGYGYPSSGYGGYSAYSTSSSLYGDGIFYSYPAGTTRRAADEVVQTQAAAPPLLYDRGLYYSEFFFLRAGETIDIVVTSGAPVNAGVDKCKEFPNALAMFIDRVTTDGVEQCNNRIISCKLERIDGMWEASLVFSPGESDRYQLVFINESGEPTECQYSVTLR